MATFDRKDDYLYIRWSKEVKKRDHFTCQICGAQGGNLNAHHKMAWASYPELRYDIDNGVTLCAGEKKSCHEIFHEIYGKGENTEEDFDEFEKIMEAMIRSSYKKAKIIEQREAIIKKLKEEK